MENRLPVRIQDEMRQSYLDYAMSVIVGRALPDVRDGLKPVHRRVLYAMQDQGNYYNKPYKKSARIVGDVIGKYHPHGDSAVYDTMVRMVQDFSLRYPLIDGQGNFGSVDGDNAAAMRYTEVRMARITSDLLADLDKETVDFTPNYDESLHEPVVLPTRLPNLLMNGSSGIAVGMATNIPPHNLGELAAAIRLLIKTPDVSVDELMALVPAPDFPTGGYILQSPTIREAYETGRGVIKMRAKAFIETNKRTNRQAVIIRELPYQVNKAKLIEDIAALVHAKKLDGISDLRDESDRDGMRVVIELKRGEVPAVILNRLYKMTRMQTSFGINNVALLDGQPRLLSLREMLQAFIEFRREVVIRRTRYELRKAEARAHILKGLVIALDNLDAVIKLIRAAPDPASAKAGLVSSFKLSEIQAQAILDMKLQRLTGLERDKILAEYAEVQQLIADLMDILARPERVDTILLDELANSVKAHDNPRRTEIITEAENLTIEDLIADEPMVVTISHTGYIKRSPTALYNSQRRGGKGKMAMGTKEEDFVAQLFIATAHNYLLCFTSTGRMHWLKVHQIPEASRNAKGRPVVNLLELNDEQEQVTAVLPVKEFDDDHFVFMCTRNGTVKKTALSAFSHPRVTGIRAIELVGDDQLVSVKITHGENRILIGTRHGQAILFDEKDVRAMGRTARGVRGASLGKGDYVINAELAAQGADMLTVSCKGYGKRSAIADYRQTKRGSKGVRTLQITEKTGEVAGILQVTEDDQVVLIADSGKLIRFKVKEVRRLGRSTQGVKMLRVEDDETVVAVARIPFVEHSEDLGEDIPASAEEGTLAENEAPPTDFDELTLSETSTESDEEE